MKKEEFDKIKKTLKQGDYIDIHYRSNWRGGDGRGFDHRPGKKLSVIFFNVFNDRLCFNGNDFGISYKAIKSIKITERYSSNLNSTENKND